MKKFDIYVGTIIKLKLTKLKLGRQQIFVSAIAHKIHLKRAL